MSHGFYTRQMAPKNLRTVDTHIRTPFLRMFDIPLTQYDPAQLDLLEESMSGDGPVSTTPAGFTFLGQFIDHDLTLADPKYGNAPLDEKLPISEMINVRSPNLELDSVFGFGPEHPPSKKLFTNEGFLKTGSDTGGNSFDVPRENNGKAIIGDMRNDENLIIVQVHALFIRFFNALRHKKGLSYPEARLQIIHYYQRILMNDYFSRFIQKDVLNTAVQDGAPLYQKLLGLRSPDLVSENALLIPVEFAVSAFRFGHSQVRRGYRLNGNNPGGLIFPNLRGGQIVDAANLIDWSLFFQLGDQQQINMAMKIDTQLADPLRDLPDGALRDAPDPDIAPEANPRSLAKRNLRRDWQHDMPSGQDVAKSLGVLPVAPHDIPFNQVAPEKADAFEKAKAIFREHTPLWYYVLAEAQVGGGEKLGLVGSHILAETFIGILRNSTASILNGEPAGMDPNIKTMADMITFTDS